MTKEEDIITEIYENEIKINNKNLKVVRGVVCVGHLAPCWATTSVKRPLNQVFTHNTLMHHVAARCALMQYEV